MTITKTIETLLMTRFKDAVIEITNESNQHAVAPDTESHFRVVVISDEFIDTPLLGRHRLVYETLSMLLKNVIHALALHTYTVTEWKQRAAESLASPACRGGSKK